MLLALADGSKAERLNYGKLKDPEALQAALVEVLQRDGVELADNLLAAIELRTRVRAAARALAEGRSGDKAGKAVRGAADAATMAELWSGDDAVAALDAALQDAAQTRATQKILLRRLRDAVGQLTDERDVVLDALATAAGQDRLDGTLPMLGAAACLRAHGRELLVEALAGAKKPDADLRRELAELGVRLPAGGQRR